VPSLREHAALNGASSSVGAHNTVGIDVDAKLLE
jgi:hypothetical protein